MTKLKSLSAADLSALEDNPRILQKIILASRQLAELKGLGKTLPNQAILINTLYLQEAKDSSAIENIITTHDELFKNQIDGNLSSQAGKEVLNYSEALHAGFQEVSRNKLITVNTLIKIQEVLEKNSAGLRTQAGTKLLNATTGAVVYVPPQNPDEIISLMSDLEKFINQSDDINLDPLIKMALIHHQFESIHPFFDGNGRIGRILNILYLVKEKLLDIPVLYLSKYIVEHKDDYYRLLQSVRDDNAWEDWVLYILTAVEQSSIQTIQKIKEINALFADYKKRIRSEYTQWYSQDLLNNLFIHPYTKVDFLKRDINVTRKTATKYLDILAGDGFLEKIKSGRSNYYINTKLVDILTK